MEPRKIVLWTITAVCMQVAQLAHAQFDNPGCGRTGEACCQGFNQLTCNDGLTCLEGTCRDFRQPTPLEDMPILTMDLVVTSCSDQSAILMGGSGPVYWVEMGTGDRMYVDTPQALFQAGAVDSIGLRVGGVGRIRDIESISLGVANANICVSKIGFVANGFLLFEKAFEPAHRMIGTHYPISESVLTVSGAELRAFWQRFETSQTCAIPSQIEGGALQRTLTAVLGDALVRAAGSSSGSVRVNDAYFGSGGFLRTTQLNQRTLHVESKFDTFVNASGFESTVSVTIGFDITPTCADADPNDGNIFDNAVSLNISAISVLDVDGNVIEDLAISIVSPESTIAQVLNQRLDSVRDSFRNIAQSLQACPEFVVGNQSPANVDLRIDPFLLQFVGATPNPFCR